MRSRCNAFDLPAPFLEPPLRECRIPPEGRLSHSRIQPSFLLKNLERENSTFFFSNKKIRSPFRICVSGFPGLTNGKANASLISYPQGSSRHAYMEIIRRRPFIPVQMKGLKPF